MHLRVSALLIFRETPPNWSTVGYHKLVEFQLRYSFLSYLPWPINMVENMKFPWMGEIMIFCNFQNACPRKCACKFLGNSIKLKYSVILHTGRVSASVLTRTPLHMTCEHGRKIVISIMGLIDFLQFSECMSALVRMPFSEKLQSIEVLCDTIKWYSISLCTHFYPNCHALQTWSKNQTYHWLWEISIFL